MGEHSHRSGALPHPHATSLFARTVYRELRRASYNKIDLVRFTSELMDLIASDGGKVDDEIDRHVAGVVDPETGLPNHSVVDEILTFEVRRAAENGVGKLLVVCVEISIPDWCPDDVALRIHLKTAATLRLRLRPDDTTVRLTSDRYLLVLPNASTAILPCLAARFAEGLLQRTPDDDGPLPIGTTYLLRSTAWSRSVASVRELIDACLTADPLPLVSSDDGSQPVRSPSTVSSRAPERPAPEGQRGEAVVLALGGGAGRAAAHVGVIRVLAEAGIEIQGIAGTSAGALVGAMYLAGKTSDEILARFEDFASTTIYKSMRRHYAEYVRRARRAQTMDRYFRQSGWAFLSEADLAAIPDDVYEAFVEYFVGSERDIATLSRPLAIAATELVEGRPALFSRGPLHAALRASCAVPGLFAPQRDGARLLVDGAIISDVPISAAVHLQLKAPVLAVHLERPRRKVSLFSTSAEVVTRASALIHTELVREQLRHVPVLLCAPVGNIGWLDFRRARETALIGEYAARAALDELMAELRAQRS